MLVVESQPRWEYRYLRNALSPIRCRGECLLFHPGLSKVGGGNKDYIKQFPAGLDELSKYDVVFLGDVGLDDNQLTVEQCRLLKGLVEHQASGLVFMPGSLGRQFSLLDTPLGDLYPVVMDDAQPGGWGSRTPHRVLMRCRRWRFSTSRRCRRPSAAAGLVRWDFKPGSSRSS